MKAAITLLLFAFMLSVSIAQEAEYVCPLNPDYILYQQQQKAGITKITKDGYVLNEIPVSVQFDFTDYLKKKGTKQTQYDQLYDLRTLGWVSPVRDQGSCGVCWTFATMASIESWCMKSGLGEFDLSEQNLRTCHGFFLTEGTCTGGNPKKSTAYMTRFSGPVTEDESPYETDPLSVCTDIYPPLFRMSGYRAVPNNMNSIKDAILARGALYSNMYYDDIYYDEITNTYYYDGTASTDHAITLVGWDDNKLTAMGTGAWIVKNSWGDSWGENGYFYISYNDTKVNSTVAYWTEPMLFDTTETIYMYDELGQVSNRGYGDSLGYALVKYIIGSNSQDIEKVGLWVNTAGAMLEIEVYDTKSGNTLSGLLSSLTGITCDLPGYYSYELPAPVVLAAGEDFFIKVKYITPGYGYPIPYEVLSTDYAEPVIEAGVCWYSHLGSTWTATGNDIAGKEFDFCVRAYGHDHSTVESGQIAGNRTEPVFFPNPAEDIITIEFPVTGSVFTSVCVVNMIGGIVASYDIPLSAGSLLIDCSALPKGIYMLRYNGTGRKITQKLVVN